ncbi:MAG: hypothetical protein WC330_03170 [Candidatus Omnitrophota bacterium]|jgi:TRAP-type C4-dicarboxylate transport system substrate-binding protein
MIKKEKLLKELDSLVSLGKSKNPLLNKHISSSLFFSELKPQERKAILEKFQEISIAQSKHLEILSQIREEILKGKKDVY